MTRSEIDSEITVFRQRLKAVRDHYGAQENTVAWVEIEDKAHVAFDALGQARKTLKKFSNEFAELEKLLMQMVSDERDLNDQRRKEDQREMTACHDLLEAVTNSNLKKLS